MRLKYKKKQVNEHNKETILWLLLLLGGYWYWYRHWFENEVFTNFVIFPLICAPNQNEKPFSSPSLLGGCLGKFSIIVGIKVIALDEAFEDKIGCPLSHWNSNRILSCLPTKSFLVCWWQVVAPQKKGGKWKESTKSSGWSYKRLKSLWKPIRVGGLSLPVGLKAIKL